MTGTAMTEEDEFKTIYKLDVVSIPTYKPMIRKDENDLVYRTKEAKFNAVVEEIIQCHNRRQPVLVGTVSVDKSEMLSGMLQRRGVPHVVLNAKHHEREAEIVAQAGKAGAVTIATNMAGRGTDILLGGNPEFLARKKMAQEGYSEALIEEAQGPQRGGQRGGSPGSRGLQAIPGPIQGRHGPGARGGRGPGRPAHHRHREA